MPYLRVDVSREIWHEIPGSSGGRRRYCALGRRRDGRRERSAGVVPGVESRDLEGSFYELLRNRYGVEISTATQTIEPTVTNEEESAALGVPLHSPAFLFERTSRDASGRTLEFVHSIYRGDRYQIVSELTPS